MKRILFLLTAIVLCGALTMNGQARKTAKRPAAKARTTAAAKAKPKAVTPATPASDLPLFCLKGKVKKLTEKEYGWLIKEYVYDQYGNLDAKASKPTLELFNQTTYYFTEDGFLSGYEMIDMEGEKAKREFVRDAKGRVTKVNFEACYDGDGESTINASLIIKRNAAGKVTAFNEIDRDAPDAPTDLLINRLVTLRPDGKISKIANKTFYNNWNEIYSYDANGMLTKISYKSGTDTSVTNMKYDPARDAQGNWLKCEKSGRDEQVIEREIEYYE